MKTKKWKRKPNEWVLDLHFVRHKDVEWMVEDFILKQDPPLSIVTGNSSKMKKLVFCVLDRYNMKYVIFSSNLGEVIVL